MRFLYDMLWLEQDADAERGNRSESVAVMVPLEPAAASVPVVTATARTDELLSTRSVDARQAGIVTQRRRTALVVGCSDSVHGQRVRDGRRSDCNRQRGIRRRVIAMIYRSSIGLPDATHPRNVTITAWTSASGVVSITGAVMLDDVARHQYALKAPRSARHASELREPGRRRQCGADPEAIADVQDRNVA